MKRIIVLSSLLALSVGISSAWAVDEASPVTTKGKVVTKAKVQKSVVSKHAVKMRSVSNPADGAGSPPPPPRPKYYLPPVKNGGSGIRG